MSRLLNTLFNIAWVFAGVWTLTFNNGDWVNYLIGSIMLFLFTVLFINDRDDDWLARRGRKF